MGIVSFVSKILMMSENVTQDSAVNADLRLDSSRQVVLNHEYQSVKLALALKFIHDGEKYQRTGRDHFERWKLKGISNHHSRIVEEALQEAIEDDSSTLSLSDLFENEIEKIGNLVRTLDYETEDITPAIKIVKLVLNIVIFHLSEPTRLKHTLIIAGLHQTNSFISKLKYHLDTYTSLSALIDSVWDSPTNFSAAWQIDILKHFVFWRKEAFIFKVTTSIQRLVYNYETDYLFDSGEIDAFAVMMKLLAGIDKDSITNADRFFLETEAQKLLTQPELRNQLHYIVGILESLIYPDLVKLEEDCTIAQYLAGLDEDPEPKETNELIHDEVNETDMQT